MIDEIRSKLDKATEDLIESFIEFDRDKVLQLKVGLHAIQTAQSEKQPASKSDLYSICNYKQLYNLLEEYGIPRHEFERLPSMVKNGNKEIECSKYIKEALNSVNAPNPIMGIPTTGMIAVMFNMVSEKAKNALIAGQAGERTLRAVERVCNISYPYIVKSSALQDILYDYGSKKKPARPYIGSANEPDYLVSAQATHHLADLLESAVKLCPEAINLDVIKNSIAGFNKLAACIFMYAADNLNMAKVPDAAEKIRELALHIENTTENLKSINDNIFDTIEEGMRTLKEILSNAGTITEQELKDYEELLNKRIAQVKKMEVA